ncbi:MAG TPA: YbhB/YbcL family Raf kinase inhibitor-like protein [Acidobacteriota bacterium]
MAIKLTSTAFIEGEMIPRKYTCDGPDISPQLDLGEIPAKAQSIALICDDPDAPAGTWVHWVLYDWPVGEKAIPQGIPGEKNLANGAKQGINDFRRIGYGGPCPPGGTHRYFFKIYALDIRLNLVPGLTKAKLLEAMKGHILAEGQLMGKYKR